VTPVGRLVATCTGQTGNAAHGKEEATATCRKADCWQYSTNTALTGGPSESQTADQKQNSPDRLSPNSITQTSTETPPRGKSQTQLARSCERPTIPTDT